MEAKPFVEIDSFIRHIDRKNRMTRAGAVLGTAFAPRGNEESLSFTHQDETLKSEDQIVEYQKSKQLPSGDLPGLCRLTLVDLTVTLIPHRPPWRDPNPADEKYGALHCSIALPVDVDHQERMAKLATKNAVIRQFVEKKKVGSHSNS